MADKQTWDDIPSLKLEMDTDYENRVKSKEGRGAVRVDSSALKSIITSGASVLPIRIATAKQGVFDGTISDISETGARLVSPKILAKGERIKVGFKIDDKTIISKATVRWISNKDAKCMIGIEFEGLVDTDKDFLRTLTTASLFNKTGAFRV